MHWNFWFELRGGHFIFSWIWTDDRWLGLGQLTVRNQFQEKISHWEWSEESISEAGTFKQLWCPIPRISLCGRLTWSTRMTLLAYCSTLKITFSIGMELGKVELCKPFSFLSALLDRLDTFVAGIWHSGPRSLLSLQWFCEGLIHLKLRQLFFNCPLGQAWYICSWYLVFWSKKPTKFAMVLWRLDTLEAETTFLQLQLLKENSDWHVQIFLLSLVETSGWRIL